jgi:putative ATPase
MPECRINLAQGAVYMALAPKSNSSYAALQRAEAHVREHGAAEPPAALRSAAYPGAKKLGRGVGYRYPHNEPGAVNDQRALPDSVNERFFAASDRGFEAELGERLERIAKVRRAGGSATDRSQGEEEG